MLPILIITLLLTLTTIQNQQNLVLNNLATTAPKNITLCFNITQNLIINVTAFSGTDQEKIQTALNMVPPEGATVYIPDGTWEACNLTAKSKTIIMGGEKTTLKRPSNTTTPFITFTNASDFAILNITFDGQNIPDATGVYITNSTNFLIYNNTFKDISRNALKISGKSTNFTIKNNKFINTNNAPLMVFGSPGTREIANFTITANTIINSTENGKIAVAFASDGIISGNIVLNSQHGIGTRGISNIIMENNTIINCKGYGIYLGTQPTDPGSWNITIENNYIANNSIGLARYYGTQPIKQSRVMNNIIVNNTQYDVQIDFPATFIKNIFTSKEKIKILTPPIEFKENTNMKGEPIIPADINNDQKVDAKDIGITATLFGTNYESPKWNPACDVIEDGVIDSKDLGFICKCFGKK
jgi:hypothetical protein